MLFYIKKTAIIETILTPNLLFFPLPIDTGEELTTSSTTATSTASSKRRRSSLAQLTELLKLKEWGIWDKDKFRDKGNYILLTLLDLAFLDKFYDF